MMKSWSDGGKTFLVIGENEGTLLATRLESGNNVGDNRSWLPGGVIVIEVGDGGDIACWRANGDKSSPTKTLLGDLIAQFYGTGLGDTRFIPDSSSPIYSGYDGENIHTASGAGPYAYSAVALGAETDVACYAYNNGDPFNSYRLLAKTVDYTLNLGAKELTLTGSISENRIVIRRRRDWSGSGPFLGRSGEIIVQATEDFSDESRPSVIVLGVCQSGEVVARPRVFAKGPSVVMVGRASHEDFGDYPDNKNLESKWRGFQGVVNPGNYTPKSMIDFWISDIEDNSDFNGESKPPLAVTAWRKGSDPNNQGWDWGYEASNDELSLYGVDLGVRKKLAGFPRNGGVRIGSSSPIKSVISEVVTIDFPAIPANSYQQCDISMQGAKTWMQFTAGTVNASLSNAALSFDGWVMSQGSARVYCRNHSQYEINPGSQTIRITLFEF